VFDRGVVLVTLPARLFGIDAGRFAVFAEIEICPLFGESGLILHFDTHAHEIGLKVAGLIDRTFALRSSFFDDEHGFVGPDLRNDW